MTCPDLNQTSRRSAQARSAEQERLGEVHNPGGPIPPFSRSGAFGTTRGKNVGEKDRVLTSFALGTSPPPRLMKGYFEGLDAAIERAIVETERPGVRSTLPEETPFRCVVDYPGAYACWDLLSGALDDANRDLETIEDCTENEPDLPVIDRENDPPIASVWH